MGEHVKTQTDERAVVPYAERVIQQGDPLRGEASLIEVTPENDGVPTQVANPRRATWRTVVATLVGLVVALPTINAVLLSLQSYLTEQTDVVIPAWVWLALNAAVAAVALISGIITRVLAVPGVNEWVKAHLPGLAAIPLK